jgi:hypothetical protein
MARACLKKRKMYNRNNFMRHYQNALHRVVSTFFFTSAIGELLQTFWEELN